MTSAATVALQARFAGDLPELSLPWQAQPVPESRLVQLNAPLADELGLDPHWLREPEGTQFLVGGLVPPGATPVAQAYAGHQFGGFAPVLGDGRALLLGELTDRSGQVRDLHLKGAGRTPFARGGDGQAALGPMLREFVVSEAMHALGIPTTRSLAVVATGRGVQRESVLPGAVLTRVASSHLRVGSFQYAAARGDVDLLRRLTDHAIARHHPQAASSDRPALALFEAVVSAQATLVAQWMLVGFIHGVMNTDNMTISGETIDYGPCAFLDAVDPATVYSSIDRGGRYAYGNQPVVAEWNLARLAEALLPLFDADQEAGVALAVEALGGFRATYSRTWSTGMRAKLGLSEAADPSAAPAAAAEAAGLLEDLLRLAQADRVDHTRLYRLLADAARGDREPVRAQFLDLAGVDAWLERWLRLVPDADAMDRVNPVYIPRNHLVEEALDAAVAGDLAPFEGLLAAVRAPYADRTGWERYAEPAPREFAAAYQTFCGT